MNDLARANGGQVAITLIGEDDPVGQDALTLLADRTEDAVKILLQM